MRYQKNHCSVVLGHLQMLSLAVLYPSALLSVSTAQKTGEELEKRATMELCTEKYFHAFFSPLSLLV